MANERVENSALPVSGKRGCAKPSELEASDVAFLAPELIAEVEGPIRVPERAERRLAYRIVKRTFDIVFSLGVIAVLLVPSVALCIWSLK